jgi:segregation and condensation protein B
MSQFDKKLLKKIIEGLLLASNEPLSVKRMIEVFADQEIFGDTEKPDAEEIQAAIDEIQADCRDHGYELKEVASGWRYQVRQELAAWIGRLWEEKPVKYSRAILETLALIAYRQPITRGDIEEIRGVAVSTTIVKTLMERQWVRIVGHRDVPGRPALYATTRQFLDYFNLKSLDELPSLGEIRDLDKINAELDFNKEQQVAEALAPMLAAQVGGELAEEDAKEMLPEYQVDPADIADNDVPDSSVLH